MTRELGPKNQSLIYFTQTQVKTSTAVTSFTTRITAE